MYIESLQHQSRKIAVIISVYFYEKENQYEVKYAAGEWIWFTFYIPRDTLYTI